VSLGDLDGDGDLDALVINDLRGESGSAVWLNDGKGIFTSSGQSLGYGMGHALGDVDADGDLDAFVVSLDEAGQMWLNDGTGAFVDSEQEIGTAGGWDAALGDLDGDGDLDALVGQSEANTVWLNDGNGVYADSGQRLGTAFTAAVALGDLDSDGDLDAVTIGWGEAGKAWLNDGTGTLSDNGGTLTPSYVHIHGMALGDLDGDGDLDAFTAGNPNQVWFNDGAGSFSEGEQNLRSQAGDSVALGDLDGDGDLDAYLAVGDWSGCDDKIWVNDGQGRFSDSGLPLSATFSSGSALGDLDGDGDLDAFVVHGELGQESGGGIPNEVWLNQMLAPESTVPATTMSSPTPAAELLSLQRDFISVENAADVVELRSAEIPGFLDIRETCGVAFSPDGRLIASASNDRTVRLWEVGSGEKLATLQGHTDLAIRPVFDPSGALLASVSWDGTARSWGIPH